MNGIAGVSTMAWIYLFIAAICEVGWPVGMKLAAVHPAWRIVWILFAAIAMTLSGVFLYLAQRDKIYQPPALHRSGLSRQTCTT